MLQETEIISPPPLCCSMQLPCQPARMGARRHGRFVSPPWVPLCQGWDRGAAVGRAVVASGLHHQPLVPGKYLLKQLCQCFQVRKAEMFLSDSCGSFCISKTRWLFPPLIESGSFQNEKLSKLYVDI